MKFFVLGLFLVSMSASAADNMFHTQYTLRDTVAGQRDKSNRQGVNFTLMHKVSPNLIIDIGSQSRTDQFNRNVGTYANRLETGATLIRNISTDYGVYARGALGQKFTNITDNAYFSMETGLRAQVNSALLGRVAYRFRDSFKDNKRDQTNTIRLAAEYTVTPTSVFTLGIDRSYGDSEFLGYNLGYLLKF
jgi:hypothetical protein